VSERHTETGTQLVLRVPAEMLPAFESFKVADDTAETPSGIAR
jgi:hypothetical protein